MNEKHFEMLGLSALGDRLALIAYCNPKGPSMCILAYDISTCHIILLQVMGKISPRKINKKVFLFDCFGLGNESGRVSVRDGSLEISCR